MLIISSFAAKHRFGSELRKKENCIELRLNDFVPIFAAEPLKSNNAGVFTKHSPIRISAVAAAPA